MRLGFEAQHGCSAFHDAAEGRRRHPATGRVAVGVFLRFRVRVLHHHQQGVFRVVDREGTEEGRTPCIFVVTAAAGDVGCPGLAADAVSLRGCEAPGTLSHHVLQHVAHGGRGLLGNDPVARGQGLTFGLAYQRRRAENAAVNHGRKSVGDLQRRRRDAVTV